MKWIVNEVLSGFRSPREPQCISYFFVELLAVAWGQLDSFFECVVGGCAIHVYKEPEVLLICGTSMMHRRLSLSYCFTAVAV